MTTKKIGIVVFVLFVIEIAGCGWLFNQQSSCPEGYDQTVQGCKGMPPFKASLQDADVTESRDVD